ncbi:unnamed protein product, partial [Symbiodinium sp. KB8]
CCSEAPSFGEPRGWQHLRGAMQLGRELHRSVGFSSRGVPLASGAVPTGLRCDLPPKGLGSSRSELPKEFRGVSNLQSGSAAWELRGGRHRQSADGGYAFSAGPFKNSCQLIISPHV